MRNLLLSTIFLLVACSPTWVDGYKLGSKQYTVVQTIQNDPCGDGVFRYGKWEKFITTTMPVYHECISTLVDVESPGWDVERVLKHERRHTSDDIDGKPVTE